MRPKPISRDDCVRAMKYTKSNLSASRYLGCSYQHYKRYAKLYKSDILDESSPTLFEIHKNQSGKGIPKFLPNRRKEPAIKKILETGEGWESFKIEKLKSSIIVGGFLEDKCHRCNFEERRVGDYKIPLLLHFKDRNKTNWKLNNLGFLCYNCYYLTVGDVFNYKELREIEDIGLDFDNAAVEWELSDDVLENMKLLGLLDDEIVEGEEFVDKLN